VRARRCPAVGEAIRAATPVRDLGFVNFIALAVGGRQTRRGADGTIDVNQTAADPANQVVMIIADAIFESGRQPRGLNAADEAFGHEYAERIIDRLQRDGADFGPDELGDAVGSDMRLARPRA